MLKCLIPHVPFPVDVFFLLSIYWKPQAGHLGRLLRSVTNAFSAALLKPFLLLCQMCFFFAISYWKIFVIWTSSVNVELRFCQSWQINRGYPNVKKICIKCQKMWHLQMDTFCHFKFCHNRRNGFWVLLCSQLTNAWHDKHKISIETIDDEHHLKLKKTIQKYAGVFLYKHFVPGQYSLTRSWLNQKLWCKIQIDYEYTNLFDPFNCCCTFSLQEG